MEAGSKIGNSLRTIYSRLTTMPDSVELLESFGIALYEMGDAGPEVRDVGDILQDLGGIWKDLNAEQQQSIGFAAAGRSRLTQFLALMNNYESAVGATTTALNSQGSAMREQREYMKSYEYQMSVLGATASDVALTMEEEFVGDAMYLVIATTTDLLEILDQLFEKFGVLPTILGGATGAMLLFNDGIGKVIGKVAEFASSASGVPAIIGKVSKGLGGLSALGKGFLGLGIVGGIMAIATAIEYLVSKWADNKRAIEEAELAMDEAVSAYNSHGQDINALIDRYDELNEARKRSADGLSLEEEREYNDLVGQISTMMPTAVQSIDAQGQAHLRNTDYIRGQVTQLEHLAKANEELVAIEMDVELAEQAESMADITGRLADYAVDVEAMNDRMGESFEDFKARMQATTSAVTASYTDTQWLELFEKSNKSVAESMAKTGSEYLAFQYQMSSTIQQATVMIGEQSVAMLNSQGELENTSSSAEALIQSYASFNEEMFKGLETQEEYGLAIDKLQGKNLEFGQVVASVYDTLAQGMDGIDPSKAIESMDMLVNALPVEFFEQSTDKMSEDLVAMGDVVTQIVTGADVDVDSLITTLTNAGVESSIAKDIVRDVGVAMENQSIKTAIANEELAEYNEELIKTKDVAIEAINPLEQLFGFMGEETQAMDSHVQTLQILRSQYGDTWTEMAEGEQSIEALAIAFGQSEEFVVQNLDQMAVAIRALNGATSVWSEESQSYVLQYDESVSQSTKDFLANMLAQGDGFENFTSYFASQAGVVTETQEQLEKRTEKLTARFNDFYKDPSENNHNLLLTEIQTHLNDLDGTFVTVEDSAGNLKLAMADGSESPFLTNLNSQLGDSGLKITETINATTGLTDLLITGPNGEELKTLYSLNEQAESGDLAIGLLKESHNALVNETTSAEDRETYIAVLDAQMKAFGENIVTTTDKQGNLKLEFAGGGSSPWLEALNSMIGETGFQLESVEDDLGNVNYILKDPSGNVLFESAKVSAEELNNKVDESKTKVDELKVKAGAPTKINLDGSGAYGEIENVDLKYDQFVNGLSPEGETPKLGLDGTPAGEEIDSIKLRYDGLLGKVNPETGAPTINLDGTQAKTEIAGVEGSINELDNNNVDLKIDPESITTFNDAVDKLKYAQEEVKTAEQKLQTLKADLALTGESLQTIMANVGTLSNANSSMQTFIDKTKEARENLGFLYQDISVGTINTSGIVSAASVISEQANSMKASFDAIRSSISNTNISLAGMSTKFNITPLVNYRVGAQNNMALTIQSFALLAANVPVYMDQINRALRFNTEGLANARTTMGVNLSAISRMFDDMANNGVNSLSNMSFRISNTFLSMATNLSRLSAQLKQNVYENISSMSQDSIRRFVRFVNDFIDNARKLNTATVFQATRLKKDFTDKISEMTRNSMRLFYDMANDMVTSASSLPSRIGKGIRDNMADASSSMQSLADDMVRRFKKALGIHSPSRVFYELGGHVIDGLVNGLGDKDLKSLGKDVFNDFGGGIFDTWDMIKAYVSGDFSNIAGGSVQAFAPTAMKALMMTGQYSQANLERLLMQMQSESGGNAKAINLWDSNAKAGIPSKGLMQVIDPTFQAYAMQGYNTNIWDPLSNILASIRYAVSRYGSLARAYRGVGYANGGFVDEMELAWHGEEGPEAIIPLIPQRRQRGLDLWAETGERLGLDDELIKLLTASQRRTSTVSGFTSFAGLGGEAGSGGGDASATSGTVKPDYGSVMRSMGMETQPMFSGMADLDPLYKRDYQELNIARSSAFVTKANTELTALTAQTLKYRNALEEVNHQEKSLRDNTQKSLNTTVNRQKQIEKELSKLQNTGKHTEAQRKKYNDLQQEFDKNTASIYSMENEIRKLNISMSERKVEIYTDYLGQLTTGFQKLRDEITETTEDLTFSLDKLTLTDENNIGAQLRIQYDILKESMRMESTLMNNMNSLQSEYNKAVSKYGRNSEQALLAREELMAVEDSYQSSVLERIKLEQEIEKTRKDVANEGIESLKSYYKQTQTMTERAIELERKSLEKAHEHKMSLYDEEIAKIESVYDTRLQEMDEEKAESEYQQTIADLNTQRADLMSQVARASRDTTLEGRKRLAEIQAELATVNEEIATAQRDRQEELYKSALEQQKNQQVAEIELEKQKAEELQAINLESLDKQIADSKKYSEDMINDEAMWAELSEKFVSGDTSPLAEMMYEMQNEMSRFMSGNYKGISMGYDYLSEEDKASFSDDTLLEISNLMLSASESLERFTTTSNERVQNINGVSGKNYSVGTMTNWNKTTLSSQGKTAPNIPAAPKPAPKPKQDNRYYTIKKNDTLWDLAQKYYGNPYKWTTIAQANQNPDPRKLQIGRKLLIPFKTGGFTGDWTGDAGRLAVLHKKELVLNEGQTKDILNVAKIVDKITGAIPKVQVNRPNINFADKDGAGETYIIDNLNMTLEGFSGTKDDARRAFDVMAKELKKRGK